MLNVGEDELICDMAEVYSVYSYDTLPVLLYATLAAGLKDSSRIRTKMDGHKPDTGEIILAMIFDKLSYVFWDGEGNKPKSLSSWVLGIEEQKTSGDKKVYNSPEDFEREWEEG